MSAPTEHDLLKLTPAHIIGSVLDKATEHKHDPQIIAGLSTAIKPVDLVSGSIFLETDTGKFYIWDGEDWEVPSGEIEGTFSMTDGSNIVLGTSTGTKIGTATTQKIGFYNATPVVQGASIADVNASTVDNTYGQQENDVITDLRTKVNSLISRLEATGLIATV